jgi:pimeloyl-ACP methyl ester carboxylesterase
VANFNYRREVIPLFSDNEIKRLTMPTILFMGEKDIMFRSAKTANRLENLLPQGKINIIPGAGHVLINLTNNIIPFIEAEL